MRAVCQAGQQRPRSRAGKLVRRCAPALTAIAAAFGIVATAAPTPALAVGGELIIIDSVKVAPPATSTYSSCTGWVDQGGIVIPVTISATVLPPPGEEVTGPYATATWSGGFGSSDDHFGTEAGKDHHQFFHILLRPDSIGDYHGQGDYYVSAVVQDVGLAGGYAEKDNIKFNIPPPPPFHSTAKVKCTPVKQFNLGEKLNEMAWDKLQDAAWSLCEGCKYVKEAWSKVRSYADYANDLFGDVTRKDPPDANYQEIAQPDPPPVLPLDPSLTTDQAAAFTNLEQGLATAIGDERAVLTTMDRIWGADNAGSAYWHQRQLTALASFSNQTADDFAALQQLFDDAQAVTVPIVPQSSDTEQDASQGLADREYGLPSYESDIVSQLGASAADQQQMADDALTLDPMTMTTDDGLSALAGQNFAGSAGSMRQLAAWAASTTSYDRPVVTSVTPGHVPSTGGPLVTIGGTNLQDVTGINFGTSTPGNGQGLNVNCTDTQCTTNAPPGTGTVDVVAIGPGGPSVKTTADRITYDPPPTPQVDNIYPTSGNVSDTRHAVSVFGSGLSGGTVYFGPAEAESWSCTDEQCTAYPPPSAQPGTVDVTVVNTSGSSPTVAADQYTYTLTTPPTEPAPVVTGVSPAHGSDLGGETVTITGSNFTHASEVDFGTGFDGRKAQTYRVLSDSTIEATSPGGTTGTVDVIVYNPSGASAVNAPADQYTFDSPSAPVITSISPTSGPDIGGTKLTITGTDFGNGFTNVIVGDNWIGDAVCTSTQCTVTTPPGADGTVDVSVESYDGTSSPSAATKFTYTHGPAPTISSMTPDTGTVDGGTTIAIYGSNLNGGNVTVDGMPTGDWQPCNFDACVVTAPQHAAGTVDVAVTTEAGTTSVTAADKYSYVKLPIPSVDSILPTEGWLAGDTQVTIYGHDLTNGNVYFGDQLAWESSCTATVCTASSPDSTTASPVHITVQTPSGTSLTSSADEFTYIQPEVTSISPTSGYTSGGTKVTITGTHLSDQTLTTGGVYFGNSGGYDFTCSSDTTCTTTTPQHAAGTVDVQVQTFITKSPVTPADQFTFFPRPVPTVTAVSPTSGTLGGGDQVIVTGTDLGGGTVRFGGINAVSGSCTSTTCTVVTPYHGSVGVVDVTVVTPAGTSATSTADQYSFAQPGTPTITGVSPASGSAAGGTAVTINGSNLTKGTVSFGGTAATGVTCYATTCTATAPAHAAGAVDVRVATTGGTSAVAPADQYSYVTPPAPTVTAVSPSTGPRSGGTSITVTGTDLTGASLMVGGKAATSVTCTATSCTALTPGGAAGAVDVVATTIGGTSTTSAADLFTFSRFVLAEHAITGVTTGTGGGGIVPGIGGDMWFTMPSLDKVGRISSGGTTTTYAVAGTSGTVHPMPVGITEGPDGRMWFAEENTNTIVAIDGSGTQTSYPIAGVPTNIRFITAGPDGRLWFTLAADGAVGAITTSGVVSLYKMPDPTVAPYNIITGADGRLWFTEVAGDNIGAITTSGVVTEYPLPDKGAMSWGISRGPDNRIWFAEEANRAIGAVTTRGVVTMYTLPDNDYDPEGLTYGPDGRMWFGAYHTDQVGALDPATGDVADYDLPAGSIGQHVRYIASDANGTLWATEVGGTNSNTGKNVVSIDGITQAVAPTVSSVSPAYGSAGDTVTITGTDLGGASSVTFGGATASYTVVDPGHVTATVPAGSGTASVLVTTANGTSAPNADAVFHYGSAAPATPVVTGVSPSTGSTAGGDVITVTGTDLSGGTVAVGGVAATGVSCSATSCTATTPAGPAGDADVVVTTAGGASAVSSADRFTYEAPAPPAPSITSVSPSSGSIYGGDSVTITGTNLTNGTVTFGAEQASGTCTATSCSVVTPRNGAGAIDVRVDTPGGRTPRVAGDVFTYVPATLTSTSVALGASPTHAAVGAPITLTAVVSPTNVEGKVQFKNGYQPLGNPVTVSGGQAQTTLSTLTAGAHTLTAVFTPSDLQTYAPGTGTVTVSVGATASKLTVPSSRTIKYGASTTITTTLKDTSTSTGIAGAAVTLYKRLSSTAAWSKVTSKTTSSSGAASVAQKPTRYTQYQWRYAGDSSHQAATSATESVSVAQVVAVKVTKTSAHVGNVVKIYGTVKPTGKGKVYLQRRSGTSWKSVTAVSLVKQRLPDGRTVVGYVFSVKMTTKGTFTYRIYRPATSTLAKGYSPNVSVKVT